MTTPAPRSGYQPDERAGVELEASVPEPDAVRAGRELARRTRAEQGLPPKVEDPALLRRVARLLQERAC